MVRLLDCGTSPIHDIHCSTDRFLEDQLRAHAVDVGHAIHRTRAPLDPCQNFRTRKSAHAGEGMMNGGGIASFPPESVRCLAAIGKLLRQ